MEFINSLDEFDNFEFSKVDEALLMSFLDDAQVEDCDNEKLSSVIRSLEAEIDQHIIDDDQNSSFEDNNWTSNLSDHDEEGHFDGQDHSRLDHDLDFNWMDMDMEMEMVPSPSDGMASWCMDPCGDGMDGVAEFGFEKDYYFQYFNGVSFEDQECSSYGTLWQETNAPLVH